MNQIRTPMNDSSATEDQLPEVARRLVVELTRRSAQDLAWLVDQEDLNKTSVVNRAVQVYKRIVEAQENGQRVSVGGSELWIV